MNPPPPRWTRCRAACSVAPSPARQPVALRFAIWTGGVLALNQRNATTPTRDLMVEGAGLLVVAVALAAALRLAGHAEPGESVASIIGTATIGLIIVNPPPRSVPVFPIADGWAASTTLWGCLTIAARICILATSHDVYRATAHPVPRR